MTEGKLGRTSGSVVADESSAGFLVVSMVKVGGGAVASKPLGEEILPEMAEAATTATKGRFS